MKKYLTLLALILVALLSSCSLEMVSGGSVLDEIEERIPTITFYLSEGGEVLSTYQGSSLRLPEENPSKEGFVFAGWAYDPDGNNMVPNSAWNALVSQNTAIYAIFRLPQTNNYAVINETRVIGYETFPAAFNDVQNGETLRLNANVELSQQIVIENKNLTLDLAGYSITRTDELSIPNGLFRIADGGALTVNDSSGTNRGSINVSKEGEATPSVYAVFTVQPQNGSKASLTINGGAFTAPYYPISGNGTVKTDDSTYIEINGGVFTATDEEGLAIYHPQNGTMIINGGTFSGYDSAIEIRAGNLKINDGTFTALDRHIIVKPVNSGNTTQGAAIAIAQHTTKLSINVEINGGTFNAYAPFYESNPQGNEETAIADVKISITGGDFNTIYDESNYIIYSQDKIDFISGGSFSQEFDTSYLAHNHMLVARDGRYIVEASTEATLIYDESDFLTKNEVTITHDIDSQNFTDSAANVLSSGKYILMENIETEHMIYIPEGAVVELDLNGYMINGKGNYYTIGNWGTLTINDSSESEGTKGTGGVYNSSTVHAGANLDAIRTFGTLTINAGTFGDSDTITDNDNKVNYGAAVYTVEGATTTINGGYFTCVDNYGKYTEGSTTKKEGDIAHSYALRSTGTVIIHDCHVYGKMNGGIGPNDGSVTIYDGLVDVYGASAFHTFTIKTDDSKNPLAKVIIYGGEFRNTDTINGHVFSHFSGMPSWEVETHTYDGLAAAGYEIHGGTFIEDGNPIQITN